MFSYIMFFHVSTVLNLAIRICTTLFYFAVFDSVEPSIVLKVSLSTVLIVMKGGVCVAFPGSVGQE